MAEPDATDQELGLQRVMEGLLELYKRMLAARLPLPAGQRAGPMMVPDASIHRDCTIL